MSKQKESSSAAAANAKASSRAARAFLDLALATLADARRYAEAVELRGGHPDIRGAVAKAMPTEMRVPLAELRAAEDESGKAQWLLDQAGRGVYYDEELARAARDDAVRVVAMLEGERDRAVARLQDAQGAMRDLCDSAKSDAVARMWRAEAEVVDRWIAHVGGELARHRDEYRAAFVRQQDVLAAIDRQEARLDTLRGTSACHILMKIADALVDTRRVQLCRDMWDQLEILVSKEVAVMRSNVPPPRKHAAGTLDERALRRAKEWQRVGRPWTLKELAADLETSSASLVGKRGGGPRCPLFHEFWNDVQKQRAEAKLERGGGAVVDRRRTNGRHRRPKGD